MSLVSLIYITIKSPQHERSNAHSNVTKNSTRAWRSNTGTLSMENEDNDDDDDDDLVVTEQEQQNERTENVNLRRALKTMYTLILDLDDRSRFAKRFVPSSYVINEMLRASVRGVRAHVLVCLRISIENITRIARSCHKEITLEKQRSNANAIMTKTQLALEHTGT